MPIYEKSMDVGDIKPYFNLPPMPREMIPTILNTDRTGELGDGDIATSEYMLLNYDSTTQEMRFNNYSYKGFARNQLKYMVQEVIFFNKHYSRSACFGEPLMAGGDAHRLFVTLGQFSIIRLERDAQLQIPMYDYCVPEKDCSCGAPGCGPRPEDPCELFERVQFWFLWR